MRINPHRTEIMFISSRKQGLVVAELDLADEILKLNHNILKFYMTQYND